jgi:hypothetical protein
MEFEKRVREGKDQELFLSEARQRISSQAGDNSKTLASIHSVAESAPAGKACQAFFSEYFFAIIMPRGSARRDCHGDLGWNDRGKGWPSKNPGTLMK